MLPLLFPAPTPPTAPTMAEFRALRRVGSGVMYRANGANAVRAAPGRFPGMTGAPSDACTTGRG